MGNMGSSLTHDMIRYHLELSRTSDLSDAGLGLRLGLRLGLGLGLGFCAVPPGRVSNLVSVICTDY